MVYLQKTIETPEDVSAFIGRLPSERRRAESAALMDMMSRLSGEPPKLWGHSIIGFGRYDYVYESGHCGSSMRAGFSPRKAALSIYIQPGLDGQTTLLKRLGPHTIGKSCLYIKDLQTVDPKILEEIISGSLAQMAARYP